MEYVWCLLVLKTIFVIVSAFPANPNFQSRPVRQLYNSDHLGGIFGSRQFPNYFNSYNPNQNSFHGAGAAAGAAAASSAGAAGGAGGATAGASASAAASATGASTVNSNPFLQGLNAFQQGLGNYGSNNYNGGFGSPAGPVQGVGVQQGASQTDSYSNSQSQNNANSQNINVEALGVPLVNIGLSNSNSQSQFNSGTRTQAVNQYGNQYWG